MSSRKCWDSWGINIVSRTSSVSLILWTRAVLLHPRAQSRPWTPVLGSRYLDALVDITLFSMQNRRNDFASRMQLEDAFSLLELQPCQYGHQDRLSACHCSMGILPDCEKGLADKVKFAVIISNFLSAPGFN